MPSSSAVRADLEGLERQAGNLARGYPHVSSATGKRTPVTGLVARMESGDLSASVAGREAIEEFGLGPARSAMPRGASLIEDTSAHAEQNLLANAGAGQVARGATSTNICWRCVGDLERAGFTVGGPETAHPAYSPWRWFWKE